MDQNEKVLTRRTGRREDIKTSATFQIAHAASEASGVIGAPRSAGRAWQLVATKAEPPKAAKAQVRRAKRERALLRLEAPPGFEPGMEVLQTSALPLGDGAGWN